MATIDVKDAGNSTIPIEKPLAPGRSAPNASRPVVLSTEDKTALDLVSTSLLDILAKIIASPSTAAKQDTGNASLSSIDTKISTLQGYVDGLEALITTLNGYFVGTAAGAFSTTQNVLSTASEVVLAANTSRRFAEVKNKDASISVYIGKDTTVSAANGHLLRAGEAFGFDGYAGAIWAIAASGTPTVTTIEW